LPASAGSAIWLNGPASPFALTQTPEFAPASSRTATQRRVGVAPAPAIHATSVQISFAPAAPENGATPTCVHAATGPPVRVHSPADVAATRVVASAGFSAMRKIPEPARFVPSVVHGAAKIVLVAGPVAWRMPTPELRENGRPRSIGISSPVPTNTSSRLALLPLSKRTRRQPQASTLDGRSIGGGSPVVVQPPSGRQDSPAS